MAHLTSWLEPLIDEAKKGVGDSYLRLLDFRGSYYTRSGLLDYLSIDGFDYWTDGPFQFPRSFLYWP